MNKSRGLMNDASNVHYLNKKDLVNKKLKIRFCDEEIRWISKALYVVDSDAYIYCMNNLFCLKKYDDEITSYGYKYPNLFKGQDVLYGIFAHCSDSIVWNARTGILDMKATPTSIEAILDKNIFINTVLRRFKSKTTLKKIISILEKLDFLKILETKNNRIQINLNVTKCNESLLIGCKRHDDFNREMEKWYA